MRGLVRESVAGVELGLPAGVGMTAEALTAGALMAGALTAGALLVGFVLAARLVLVQFLVKQRCSMLHGLLPRCLDHNQMD